MSRFLPRLITLKEYNENHRAITISLNNYITKKISHVCFLFHYLEEIGTRSLQKDIELMAREDIVKLH